MVTLRRDGEAIGFGSQRGLEQPDLGIMILLQRQPCQLVEMGQQAGQRPGPADMSPFRQPEVALQQHQLIWLGHNAGEGLDFGQIRRRARLAAGPALVPPG